MHSAILLALLALAGLAIYKIASIIVTRIQDATMARQLGCGEVPLADDPGFLGLKELKRTIAADKAQVFPDYLEQTKNDLSAKLGREVSTMKIYMAGQEFIMTFDPKNIQAILATQFQDFELGSVRNAIMSKVLGDGIFVQDGKKWEHSRAMLRPNFVRDQISDLDMEERHVQNLISVIPVQEDGWTKMTDIQTLFFRMTIDSATEFLFGESVESQIAEADGVSTNRPGEQGRNEKRFSYHFDHAQKIMASKFRLNEFHWMYNPAEYKVDNKVVNDFVKTYVDRALAASSAEKDEEGQQKHKYVFSQALLERTRDPVELRAQLLNILLAGRDTTASLLSWVFHQLLRNPHVFTRLRRTIIDEFGTYKNPRNISFASLKSCQYLQHTINETLRLWSVVPTNERRSTRATTLPRGGGPDGTKPVFITANQNVEFAIHVMHRRKDIWGEDALEFKPERFVGRKSSWEFLPFNGGPRICIGQQFALTEACYVLVRLLQRFDRIETDAAELEARTLSNLTLTSCPGRLVTLRMRLANE